MAKFYSVFVSGKAHQRWWGILIGKVLGKVALWSVTLNVTVLTFRVWMCCPGEGGGLTPSPSPSPNTTNPVGTSMSRSCPAFLDSIPYLIAVGLLLPAAAAPNIKSSPWKEMLGWSFLMHQMLCCSKSSGHQVPSEAEKLRQTHRCWISNMITSIGQQEHLYINIFDRVPRVDWQH